MSKKIENEIENGFGLIADRGGYTAVAYKQDGDYDLEADYQISYHKGAFPAFNVEHFDSQSGLIQAMRNFVNDLRKWRRPEGE